MVNNNEEILTHCPVHGTKLEGKPFAWFAGTCKDCNKEIRRSYYKGELS